MSTDTPGHLWQCGRQRLTEAVDIANGPREHAEAAQQAHLYFAASSAKSLAIIAEQLAALNTSAAALVMRDQREGEPRGLSALAATVGDLRAQLAGAQASEAQIRGDYDRLGEHATRLEEGARIDRQQIQHKDGVITELRKQLEFAQRRADAKGA